MVLDYGLNYTINNMDFAMYAQSRTYAPANFQKLTAIPGKISEVGFIVELVAGTKDFVGYDIWKPEHTTFNERGAANFDPRMIKASDKRHLGNTTLTFMDGHAEVRALKKEKMSLRVFNPMLP